MQPHTTSRAKIPPAGTAILDAIVSRDQKRQPFSNLLTQHAVRIG
jgi:hypothetical protein